MTPTPPAWPAARKRRRFRAIHVQIAVAAATTVAAAVALTTVRVHQAAPDAAGVRIWVVTHR